MRALVPALLALLGAFSASAAQVALQPERPAVAVAGDSTAAVLDSIDVYVSHVLEEFNVPGLAIAVTRDGEVILSRGYGFRDLDENLPVTSRTLFAIGSITKSFTVTVLGMLADEGKLDWDEPVRTYMPEFQLYDEVATRLMTPRDLVTHRSGLPRHDRLWYGSDLTRRQLYDRLRYLEPNRGFREVFQYQNLMFMTAGMLAGQLAGMSWEDLVRARMFEPLGMTRSNFSVKRSQKDDDFSYPYNLINDEPRQIDFRVIDEIGPAGSINSSVEEMIRYVQFHIEKGAWDGEQLLSTANSQQMQMPQMVIPGNLYYDELGYTQYGMGFMVTTYRGYVLVHHGGGIDGFISLLSFMPREGIGMIVLTNATGVSPSSAVTSAVTRGVFDKVLGLEPVDWVARIREVQARAAEDEGRGGEGEGEQLAAGTSSSHGLADFAGRYSHPAYGMFTVEVSGARLKATYNGMSTPLNHFQYDVFQAPEDPMNDFSGEKVMFYYNEYGSIDRLAIALEPAVDDIIFVRVSEE